MAAAAAAASFHRRRDVGCGRCDGLSRRRRTVVDSNSVIVVERYRYICASVQSVSPCP